MKTQKTIGTVKMFRIPWGAMIFCAVLLTGLCNVGATEISRTSPANDLALNPTRIGYPSPLESDDGWGGGVDKWDLIDGQRWVEGEWAHGLAFMKGWNQVTIDFGGPVTFNNVTAWWHNGWAGANGAPQYYNIESWNGSSWDVIVPTTSPNYKYSDPTGELNWSEPTEDIFSPVTASKVRLNCYPKDGDYMQGYHCWLYEVEVFIPEPATICLLAFGGLAILRRRKTV